jgi:cytoskeletal protein RodZ
MAIVFVEQKRTQTIFLSIFVFLLLITGLIIWQGFFKKSQEVPLGEMETFLPTKEQVKIDFNVLKKPILEKLQPFLEIQPFKETVAAEGKTGEKLGRENPFIPY